MKTAVTSRERLNALTPEQQSVWLDPAEIEFVTRGYESASLNRILAQANESKGRSYHYFANKGELFAAVLNRRLIAFAGVDDKAVINAKDPERFWREVAALVQHATYVLQSNNQVAELVRIIHREPAAKSACTDQIAHFERRLRDVLAAGRCLGAVRDDLPIELLADVTISACMTIDRWFAVNGHTLNPKDAADLSHKTFSLLRQPLLPHAQL